MAHTINQAAAALGVSRRTVYVMIAKGEVHAVRIGARQRIPATELERLLRPRERNVSRAAPALCGSVAASEPASEAAILCAAAVDDGSAHPDERRPKLSDLLTRIGVGQRMPR